MTSQYSGVCWDQHNKSWLARLHNEGKTVYVGKYSREVDAVKALDK